MKTRLSLIASISMIALLSGCMGTQNEPVVLPQEQVLQVPVDVTPQNWELSGSNYTIIPISGDMTPTYSGDSFTTVKIIDNTTQKWTYLTTYSGTWTEFEENIICSLPNQQVL